MELTKEVMSVLVAVEGMLIIAFFFQAGRAKRLDISSRLSTEQRYTYSSSSFGRAYSSGMNKVLPERVVEQFAFMLGLNLEKIQNDIYVLGLDGKFSAIEIAVLKVLGLIVFVVGGSLFASTKNLYVILTAFSVGFALFMLPESEIREAKKKRKEEIEACLPRFIEQTYLCIASGANLHDSLNYVSKNMDNALSKSVQRALVDASYGGRWSDELIRVSSGLRIESLEDFVNNVVVADATGVNIEDTLKAEVSHINRVNRSRVMGSIRTLQSSLSPLQIVFCMLPMMGIVMLPIIVQIMETL